MEGGFRRFWARRKNRSDTPQHYDLAPRSSPSIYSRPSMSTVHGRPSIALSTHAPDRAASRGNTGYKHVTSENRIQPVLVGVSRPNDSPDRPGTTGSLQHPSLQLADISVRQSSERWRAQSGQAEYHTKTTVPRYVDIFAVATTVPASYNSRYNEEIAARNLDVARPYHGDSRQKYVPSPVHRTEGPKQIIHSPQPARPSGDYPRRAPDAWKASVLADHTSRKIDTAKSSESHTYHSAAQPSISSQASQDDDSFYSRHLNGGVGKSVVHTPATEQLQFSDNGSKLPNMTEDIIASTLRPNSRPGSRDQSSAYTSAPILAGRPANEEPLIDSLNEINVHETRRYDKPIRDPNLDYALSASEPSRSPQSKQSASRLTNGDQRSIDRKLLDVPIVRLHNKSVQLPTRTIMDLTNQEDAISEVSETSSTYGYGENTPVIQQAKMDSIQRIPAQDSFAGYPDAGRTTHTQYYASQQKAQKAPPTPIPDPPLVKQEPVVTNKHNIAFSPINMLASLTPRSSTILPKEESSSPVSPDIPALDVQAIEDLTSESAPPAKMISRREETPTRDSPLEDSRSTESTPKASVKKQSKTEKDARPSVIMEAPSAKQSNTNRQKMHSPQSLSADLARRRGTPSIYESPSSLRSVDHTNPGDSFGVRTRDFAVTPQKSSTSLKKVESTCLQKSATENAARAASAQKSQRKTPVKTSRSRAKQYSASAQAIYSPEFDEVGFARKQAEARAAMERLQASLDEDLLTLPPKPVKEAKKKKPAHQDSDTDGRPVAPTTIFPRPITKADFLSNIKAAPSPQKQPAPESRLSGSLATQRISSMSSNRASTSSKAPTRKPAPPSLKYFESVVTSTPSSPRHTTMATNNTLPLPTQYPSTNKPPPSPGEISLSSFPIPSSRPTSEHEQVTLPPQTTPTGIYPQQQQQQQGQRSPRIPTPIPIHTRSNSFKSLSSMASQFSIPFHMIPNRSSSVRDIVAEEEQRGY